MFEVADEAGSDDGFSASRNSSDPEVTDFVGLIPSLILICGQDPLSCASDMGVEVLLVLAGVGVELRW